MKTRRILPSEKEKIKKLYGASFSFKVEETLVSAFLTFIFIFLMLSLLRKLFVNFHFNYPLIVSISLLIGLLSVKNKYERRKKFLSKVYSEKEPVKILDFKVQKFIKLYPKYEHQFEYLCEIEKDKSLYFMTDRNLGNKLSKSLMIELIELEVPTILSVSKIGKDSAIKIFPKELNIGFLEEIVESEFYIYQGPITDLYIIKQV